MQSWRDESPCLSDLNEDLSQFLLKNRVGIGSYKHIYEIAHCFFSVFAHCFFSVS